VLGTVTSIMAVVGVLLLVLLRVLGASVRSLSLRTETEQLESEVALARAEARFRTVFEGAPLGIAVIDVDGTLRETNAAFDVMLGYERRAPIGRTMASLVDPADRAPAMERFAQLVRGDVPA
jgi:two-component system cell cycle sensor histidine kinase/response regulator CckA